MASSSDAIDISKVRDGAQLAQPDQVAVEEPLEIRLGHMTPDGRAVKSISITMRTPGNDPELAAGFLYSEAIIRAPADIASIEACGSPAPDSGNHNVVRVDLAAGVAVDLGRLQRHFYTTSSCGVCGKTSLDALRLVGATPVTGSGFRVSRRRLLELPDALRAVQHTFAATGGLHAAAAFDVDGRLLVTMEDVGRHNAVDKVIGSLLRQGSLPARDCGLIVSGRASFELMQKALQAGMPMLAAVGAPSSLAVRLAREFDMTLVGFLRGETFNIYSADRRVID
jgi:FdhD protein